MIPVCKDRCLVENGFQELKCNSSVCPIMPCPAGSGIDEFFQRIRYDMEQIGYSEKVMEHFMNPRNVGTIENPDGYGKVGNPVCGDIMEMFISVEDDTISDIEFRTFGCGSAIATSSMVTELAKGKHIDEAMGITRKDVVDELNLIVLRQCTTRKP
ncbi:MAG: Iron-sulfur cluster assembly scaffold protein IscU 2 [Candidatus Methanogasteraceae archaeon]|nr:MAG: Iron-sulfur cluster assembly scaffold protein IscU 2 [ANME-2 cluster archaeon]